MIRNQTINYAVACLCLATLPTPAPARPPPAAVLVVGPPIPDVDQDTTFPGPGSAWVYDVARWDPRAHGACRRPERQRHRPRGAMTRRPRRSRSGPIHR